MKTDVLVVGEGVLADHVHGDLSGQYQVNRQTDFEAGIPQTTAMVLLLQDAWNPALHVKAEEVMGKRAFHGCGDSYHLEREW